jgi:hypothetical protein
MAILDGRNEAERRSTQNRAYAGLVLEHRPGRSKVGAALPSWPAPAAEAA